MEIVKRETGEVVEMNWTQNQIQLIKDTVANGSTDDELKLLFYFAQRTGLDPLAKQVHMIKRWNAALGKMAGTIQTGIDGYRVIADRTGSYAGSDAPVFDFAKAGDKVPTCATVTVYRIIQGQRVAFSAPAYWDEYVQLKKDGTPTSFWLKMPKGQLAKCAEALALRKAFPNDLSGIYTHEEMSQADNDLGITPITPKPIAKRPNKPVSKPNNYNDAPPPEDPDAPPPEDPTEPSDSGGSDNPDGSIQHPFKILSRFENGKCGFCDEKHITKGAEIWGVNMGDDKGNKTTIWGSPECFKKSLDNK